jgi:hypothetical protein
MVAVYFFLAMTGYAAGRAMLRAFLLWYLNVNESRATYLATILFGS